MADQLTYTIKFVPDHFYVEHITNPGVVPYYAIVSKTTRNAVAFAFDENFARTICMSLELVRAQVHGDKDRAKAILKLIDKLAVTAVPKDNSIMGNG